MDIKKIAILAVIALAIYVVVNDPEGSAGVVQGVFGWLRESAQSLVTFLRNVFRAQ